MRSFAMILAIVVAWTSVSAISAPPCFHFEPAVTSISGILVSKTYPGPPNYEDIKKGDQPETGWYLKLAEPICLVGTLGDELNSEDVAGVSAVQLVLTHNEYVTHARLVGKRVMATGTFFRAHTGHHHTPVLLTVTSLGVSAK